MSDSDTLWCLRHFTLMALGGIWAVPRSGLIFQKTSLHPPTLVLSNVMPWSDAMKSVVGSEHDLFVQQRADLETIREKFKLAGITVEGQIE